MERPRGVMSIEGGATPGPSRDRCARANGRAPWRHTVNWARLVTPCLVLATSMGVGSAQSPGRESVGTVSLQIVGSHRAVLRIGTARREGDRVRMRVAAPARVVAHVHVGGCDVQFPLTVVAGHVTRVLFDRALHCAEAPALLRVQLGGDRVHRVFVDSRELGIAPIDGVPVRPGVHQLDVRSEEGVLEYSRSMSCVAAAACGMLVATLNQDADDPVMR